MVSKLMPDDARLGGAFARMVARLRLTQAEVGMLLGLRASGPRSVLPVVDPGTREHVSRVLAALERATALVGDDEIVSAWLRAPHVRRGGATPLQEVARARGDVPVRFVLEPHPTELVAVVAARMGGPRAGDGAAAKPKRVRTAGRPVGAGAGV